MKYFFTVFFLFLLFTSQSFSQHCPGFGISPDEFAKRRNLLTTIMDTNSVFIIRTPEPSNEYEYLNFHQDPDFLYLTGIKDPGYNLIIDPLGIDVGGKIFQSILFVPQGWTDGDSKFNSQESPYASYRGKRDTVLNYTSFRSVFIKVLKRKKILYYTAPGFSFLYDWMNDKPLFLDKEIQKKLKQDFPGLNMLKASDLVARLRQIKSQAELDYIRQAIALTGDGIKRAIMVCRPGIWEYEIQAEIEYAMVKGGANGVSFRSIVGTGINSLSPHYDDNRCQAREGEVMVLDVGAEFLGYAADITRTIPVSGTFTPAQKTIYNVVLRVQKELIGMVRPGIPLLKIDEKASELISSAGYGKYIIHGVTHPLGLDVHDVASSDVLEAGMVITIEPGIYIPVNDTLFPADFRGFGIRIEDDILITAHGCEVLSRDIPKEIAEIEKQ